MVTTTASDAIAHAIATEGQTFRGRTTIRRDDCDVWTTYLPTYRRYETMARVPDDVRAQLAQVEVMTDSRAEAEAMHVLMCRRVEVAIEAVTR